MSVIMIGKHLVPIEQIALVEPFEPSSNPNFKPERDFKGRVVLLNRDPLLIEQTPAAFAEQHKFELLVDDQVALNRLTSFKVETFEPREDFTPTKPFRTRLKWRDPAGPDQSKLLLTAPLTVAALTAKFSESSMASKSARPRRKPRAPRQPAPAK